MTKKPTRGGARPGAGRPPTKEPTVVIRVPISLAELIRQMIQKHRATK